MSDEMDTAGIAREIARRLDRLDPGDAIRSFPRLHGSPRRGRRSCRSSRS
jgi:hypothetical protein